MNNYRNLPKITLSRSNGKQPKPITCSNPYPSQTEHIIPKRSGVDATHFTPCAPRDTNHSTPSSTERQHPIIAPISNPLSSPKNFVFQKTTGAPVHWTTS